MPGGLLNLIAVGNQNVILNGNPSKTFFKTAYSKYTNFGLQKFRLDYEGSKTLNVSEESKFTFKIPRYGDLLLDTFLVFTLPHIWSPIYPPKDDNNSWEPYEFKWIENLGTQLIKEVSITCGGLTIQKFSGNYLTTLAQRDFTQTQRDLLNKMTGNLPEFYDPASVNTDGQYPNAYFDNTMANAEPSIRGRKLYIPISAWYSFSSKTAIPLIALQYNEININITLRPIKELYTIKNVKPVKTNKPIFFDKSDENKNRQPNFYNDYEQPYNFLQPPPNPHLNYEAGQFINTWNTDIHLMSTYVFLTEDENRVFAAKDQQYLIKDVNEYTFNNVVGSDKVSIPSLGLVSSWIFYFRRTDANLRNEWTNYTNWSYKNHKPQPSSKFPLNDPHNINNVYLKVDDFFPSENPNKAPTNIYVTGPYTSQNQKLILENLAILCDGKFRENLLDSGVFNYMEKYITTNGTGEEGLYLYNFALKTSPFDLQPCGAMNLSKYKDIQFEFSTIIPPRDPNAQSLTICDENGEVVAINKPNWRIYEYTYDLTIIEESYNILTFTSGNCGLMFAK